MNKELAEILGEPKDSFDFESDAGFKKMVIWYAKNCRRNIEDISYLGAYLTDDMPECTLAGGIMHIYNRSKNND